MERVEELRRYGPAARLTSAACTSATFLPAGCVGLRRKEILVACRRPTRLCKACVDRASRQLSHSTVRGLLEGSTDSRGERRVTRNKEQSSADKVCCVQTCSGSEGRAGRCVVAQALRIYFLLI